MVRKTVGLTLICLVALASAMWPSDRHWSVASDSFASQAAARCKTVTKKVHGHRKKVRVCRPATPTPTPTSIPALFVGPSDVAIDVAGNALVAVQGLERITTLSPTGAVLTNWTDAGQNPTVFQQLYGIALDAQGNVYVSDAANHVVDKLSPTGQPLAQWNTDIAESGSFPTLLAVAPSGDVYVSDHTSKTVLHFSPGGALIGEIGKGDILDPYGVTLGPNGDLYVADFGGDRVREFTPDGTVVAAWGDGANGSVSLQAPEAIAVDQQGNVYVTEQGGQLFKFDRTGRVLSDFGTSSTLHLSDPSGLALDPAGELYVVEYQGERVDKLSPTGQILAVWK